MTQKKRSIMLNKIAFRSQPASLRLRNQSPDSKNCIQNP